MTSPVTKKVVKGNEALILADRAVSLSNKTPLSEENRSLINYSIDALRDSQSVVGLRNFATRCGTAFFRDAITQLGMMALDTSVPRPDMVVGALTSLAMIPDVQKAGVATDAIIRVGTASEKPAAKNAIIMLSYLKKEAAAPVAFKATSGLDHLALLDPTLRQFAMPIARKPTGSIEQLSDEIRAILGQKKKTEAVAA